MATGGRGGPNLVACKLFMKPQLPHCPAESVLKPGQWGGQSASLALPSFGYRQGF